MRIRVTSMKSSQRSNRPSHLCMRNSAHRIKPSSKASLGYVIFCTNMLSHCLIDVLRDASKFVKYSGGNMGRYLRNSNSIHCQFIYSSQTTQFTPDFFYPVTYREYPLFFKLSCSYRPHICCHLYVCWIEHPILCVRLFYVEQCVR